MPSVLPLPDEPRRDAMHQPGVDQDRTCQSAGPRIPQLAPQSGGPPSDLSVRAAVHNGLHGVPAPGRNQRATVGVPNRMSTTP